MLRYREMTKEQLLQEVDKLLLEMEKAEFPSQKEMLERKIWIAKSYMLTPEHFRPGTYRVEGHSETFELSYVNGIMAWGTMGSDEEASFPISMLVPLASKS